MPRSDYPTATVVILTLNPGPPLRGILEAVGNQKTDFDYETLVIDSGSNDGTLELLREFPVQVVQIDRKEFQHGRTRNLAARIAQGEFIAFLTHDAEPATPFWLADLVAGFEAADNVGAVWGKQLPRSDADLLTARELLEHFAAFGPDGQYSVQRIPDGPDGMADYRANQSYYGFFSDVNSCIRRSVWEKVPYRDLPYAEDQKMGRDLLEAGYSKVYAPGAAVYHSHSYPLGEYFRRMYDEFCGLKLAVGYEEHRDLKALVRESLGSGRAAYRYLATVRGLGMVGRLRLTRTGLLRAFLRRVAAYLVAGGDRIPGWMRPGSSFEMEVEQIDSGGITGKLKLVRKIQKERGWGAVGKAVMRRVSGNQRYLSDVPPIPTLKYLRLDPRRPAPLLPPATSGGPLTINWVVPPFGIASGGHMTIARLVQELERLGHVNNIYLFHPADPLWLEKADPAKEREIIRRHFQPVNAAVYIDPHEAVESDVTIATSWETAYVVHQLGNTRVRCYLVQDFEPAFYAVGSNQQFCENTYSFGFKCLTAGPWLAGLLHDKYGLDATPFDLAPDHTVYRRLPDVVRKPRTVVFYARWMTERRGFDLAAAALELLAERVPDLEVLFFGAETLPRKFDFNYTNLGVLTPQQLARTYNEATVGFVISLTNPSLVPFEMMACGLPVMDMNNDCTRAFFGDLVGTAITLADPVPSYMADALESLLMDASRRDKQAESGLEYAGSISWEGSGKQLEQGILQALHADQG